MSTNPVENKARNIRLAPFVIALISFALPFIQISCSGQKMVSLTGIQLVTGTTIQPNDMLNGAFKNAFGGALGEQGQGQQQEQQKVESEPTIVLTLICAAAGLVLCFVPGKTGKFLPAIAGAVGFACMLVAKSRFDADVIKQGQGILTVDYVTGFILTCVSLLAGTGLCVFQLKQAGVPGSAGQPLANPSGFGVPPPPPPPPPGESVGAWTPPVPPPPPQPDSAGSWTPPPAPNVVMAQVTQPQAPHQPMSRNTKLALAGVVALVVLSAVGYWAYNYMNRVPSNAQVRQVLEGQLKKPGQQLMDVSTKPASTSDKLVMLDFTATVQLTEACYVPIPADQYLLQQGADPLVFRKINDILNSKGAPRIQELSGVTSPVASIQDMTLLKQTVPAGQRITYSGKIRAVRQGGPWQLAIVYGPFPNQNIPVGKPITEFHENTVVTDQPEQVQKIKALMASAQVSLQKLQQAQEKYRAEIVASQQKRVNDSLAVLQAGSLFSGSATKKTGEAQPLYLEITDLDQSRQTLTVVMRNDGGWADGRRFQGTFAYNPDKDEFAIKLNSRADQAARGCGPFLQVEQNWNMTPLALDGDTFSGADSMWTYRFKRLADDSKADVVTKARAAETKWLEATRAGTTYKVTATLPDKGWSEDYLFAFTKQDENGATIEGVLQSKSTGLRRSFRGTLITNSYKAGGKSLRLISSQYVSQADNTSPLGWTGELRWYPQLDGDRLSYDSVGTGRAWHLVFEPTSEQLVAEVTPPPPANTQPTNSQQTPPAVLHAPSPGPIRAGATFDGSTRSADGAFSSRVRLRIDQVDQTGTIVAGDIESLDAPGIRRLLRGTFDVNSQSLLVKTQPGGNIQRTSLLGGLSKLANSNPLGFKINVNSPGSSSGTSGNDNSLHEEWFRSNNEYTFEFAVSSSQLSGKEKTTGWSLILESSR